MTSNRTLQRRMARWRRYTARYSRAWLFDGRRQLYYPPGFYRVEDAIHARLTLHWFNPPTGEAARETR